MDDFFKIVAAGPAFFVSAWLLMLFAGIVGTDVGIRPFGYLTSMVVTIALWLTLARPSARSPGPASPRRAEDDGAVRDGTQNRLTVMLQSCPAHGRVKSNTGARMLAR
jgi:hypothetical protein